MEKQATKTIFLLSIFLATLWNASIAQRKKPYEDPKYGPDSTTRIECVRHLSVYKEYLNVRNYESAIPSWRKALEICPQSTKNLYTDGVRIRKYQINKNRKKPEIQSKYIDSLMMVYDLRIKYFSNSRRYGKGYILGRKGVDLLYLRKEAVEEAYSYLDKSIKLQGENSEDAVLLTFMQATVGLYKMEILDGDKVIQNYERAMGLLEKRFEEGMKRTTPDKFKAYKKEKEKLEAKLDSFKEARNRAKAKEMIIKMRKLGNDALRDLDRTTTAMNGVEILFSESGAATCTALDKLFTPKFEENPNDIELLKKITRLLDKYGCNDSTELFAKAAENLYPLEPSAQSAYNLARLFVKKDDRQKAEKYYLEAIKLETSDEEKAKYYYQMASLMSAVNKIKARKYALEAAKLKPNWGAPYILIGRLYATTKCGDNPIEKSSVFWAAVDKFIQAKSIDPEVADEANALINKYTQYFPYDEDAFFHGVTKGQNYSVGCWIGESTTVRTRKKGQ